MTYFFKLDTLTRGLLDKNLSLLKPGQAIFVYESATTLGEKSFRAKVSNIGIRYRMKFKVSKQVDETGAGYAISCLAGSGQEGKALIEQAENVLSLLEAALPYMEELGKTDPFAQQLAQDMKQALLKKE